MSIHCKVSGSWRDISDVHVKVSGVWKQCKNVYIKENGVWRPLLIHLDSTGIPSLNNTKTLSNVVVGSTIVISGSTVNNVYDPDDYYLFHIGNATLSFGSLRLGPHAGAYEIHLVANNSTVSIGLTGVGMTRINGTISYYSDL